MANAGPKVFALGRRRSESGAKAAGSSQADHSSPAVLEPVTTVAIWGPAGAPGKSTVALNLADSLAVSGKRVLLVDADLVAPSLGLLVGAADQSVGISAACKLAREARLDSGELLRVSLKIDAAGSAFWLLPGISGASRWPEVTPSAIEAILRVASQSFDVAIIDLASSLEPALNTQAAAISRNELTRYVVSNADKLVALSLADAIGVHRALRQILDVQKLRSDGAVNLVINRFRESTGNSEKQLVETFQALAKISPAAFLPNDSAVVDSAVRAGVPVRLIKRRSQLAKAVSALGSQLRV